MSELSVSKNEVYLCDDVCGSLMNELSVSKNEVHLTHRSIRDLEMQVC